ncbi:Cytoskeleton associated protein 5 [Agyrium rufum]|nr:Cytoskeleton associated protein 5 [Agyrium rufum]
MADQEEDFSALPLEERFTHKVWKVRQRGYDDAAKEFEKTPDESAPIFLPFLQDPGLWKSAVADSNVAAQQSGIIALCAFLKYGGPQACTRTRNQTITPITEKGLTSTRAATKQGSIEALLLYIELDRADPVIEELLPALSHKLPKVVAATLNVLTAIVHAYGVKVVDPKPLLKTFPKVFGAADKNVRTEASNLVVELYRWLREAMKPMFWNDLKPVQQQDLEKLFDTVKQEPPPKQERLLRSQQAAAAIAKPSVSADGGEGEAEDDEEPAEIDAFDLAEPVDVLAKAPPGFFEGLASTKWSERKTALEEFLEVANVPRIKDGPFDDVMAALTKCMKDANVVVVTVAANTVEALAKGLRKAFAKHRSRIMPPMMERLKEKKQTVSDAIAAALDAIFVATSLGDCLEDIFEHTKHKNPQVKLETIKFLIRCLRNTREAPSKEQTKQIAENSIKLLSDTTEGPRAGGAEALGTLMKIMGERAMNPYLDGLDDIRKTRIKEYFETAQVKARDKPPKPAPAPASSAAQKRMGLAPGKKPSMQSKRSAASAPRPMTPPMDDPPKSMPSAKAGPIKLSGFSKPSALSGPKLTSKKAIPPPSIYAVSPRRPVQPPSPAPEEPFTPAARPGPSTLSSRSLAGRSLAKPSSTAAADAALLPTIQSLSGPERQELTQLRAESERLTSVVDELCAENARLAQQIAERENNEAQLIEERTRNVLSIKAKETQLVRARSDAEVAEETVAKQARELERLRKELGRRELTSPSMVSQDQIFRDPISHEGGSNGTSSMLSSSREIGYQRARNFIGGSPSSEKENAGDGLDGKKTSPPPSMGLYSDVRSSASSGGRTGAGTGEGMESWRRAAEVTSQLRAKIELMKARQGISLPK